MEVYQFPHVKFSHLLGTDASLRSLVSCSEKHMLFILCSSPSCWNLGCSGSSKDTLSLRYVIPFSGFGVEDPIHLWARHCCVTWVSLMGRGLRCRPRTACYPHSLCAGRCSSARASACCGAQSCHLTQSPCVPETVGWLSFVIVFQMNALYH